MRGLIGKALKGAAAAANPIGMEKIRADIMAKRDATLQSYAQQNMGAQHEFQKGERIAGQDFTAGQNEADRTQRAGEFAATQSNEQQRIALAAGQLGVEQARLGATLEAADVALQDAKLGLVEKQQIQSLYDKVLDENTPEADRTRAMDELDLRLGNQNKYQATTLYGDENEFGEQTRASGILNTRTGDIKPISLGNNTADPLGLR